MADKAVERRGTTEPSADLLDKPGLQGVLGGGLTHYVKTLALEVFDVGMPGVESTITGFFRRALRRQEPSWVAS